MSRSKHPQYKGFTKYYGWCDMYWNDKCVNCPNFHNCHRGHNTRSTWRARKKLVKKFIERLKAPIIDIDEVEDVKLTLTPFEKISKAIN